MTKGDGDAIEDSALRVYPEPMFDFGERRETCLNTMETELQVGLHGDDEWVRKRSWKELFDDNVERLQMAMGHEVLSKTKQTLVLPMTKMAQDDLVSRGLHGMDLDEQRKPDTGQKRHRGQTRLDGIGRARTK